MVARVSFHFKPENKSRCRARMPLFFKSSDVAPAKVGEKLLLPLLLPPALAPPAERP